MKTLILTIGLPRSGKSTWAKSTKLPIVNRDSIRLALHGQPYIQDAEEMVTAMETYMVKSLFYAGNDTIIIDATHLKKKYIEKWADFMYNFFKDWQWQIKYKIFRTPKYICIERAYKNSKDYLVPIIEKMDEEKDFKLC